MTIVNAGDFVAPAGLSWKHAASVTTSDSANLPHPASALYVGATGAVKVTTVGGDTVTLVAVPVGILPIAVVKVFATGTAASSIVALW